MSTKQALADYTLRVQAQASALERWGKTLMMIYRNVKDDDTLFTLANRCFSHAENLQSVGMHEQARNAKAFGNFLCGLYNRGHR